MLDFSVMIIVILTADKLYAVLSPFKAFERKFKKKKKIEMPPLSTASLPDIVFMLLFFFMVTTTMREVTLLVKLKKPQATEIQKLERKDLTTYIYIGAPKSAALGNEPRIQLADQLASQTASQLSSPSQPSPA